jgi:hypothetical protein
MLTSLTDGYRMLYRNRRVLRQFPALVLALSLAPGAFAQTCEADRYRMTRIDMQDATYTAALGINSDGDITGYYQVGTKYHSFVCHAGDCASVNVIDFPDKDMTHGTSARRAT